MNSTESRTADEAWRKTLALVGSEGILQGSRDGETKEITHLAITVKEPRQRFVFSRATSPAFAIAEVISILAGSNDVGFLAAWNPRMRRFVDDQRPYFHGAYGFRLGSRPDIESYGARLRHTTAQPISEFDQLAQITRALAAAPDSRQAVLQYWNAASDMPNPFPVSRDIPCNLVSHLMIRSGKLEWLQIMRSNDLIWGLPYNFMQFMTLQEVVAGWLGTDIGTYNHVSDSLHVYARHYGFLSAELPESEYPENKADLRIGPYEKWQETFQLVVALTSDIAVAKVISEILIAVRRAKSLQDAYRQWIHVLAGERLLKLGFTAEAGDIINDSGSFWAFAWRNRTERIASEKEFVT